MLPSFKLKVSHSTHMEDQIVLKKKTCYMVTIYCVDSISTVMNAVLIRCLLVDFVIVCLLERNAPIDWMPMYPPWVTRPVGDFGRTGDSRPILKPSALIKEMLHHLHQGAGNLRYIVSLPLRLAECAGLTSRILHSLPLQLVNGVWKLSKRKLLKWPLDMLALQCTLGLSQSAPYFEPSSMWSKPLQE